MDTLQYSGQEIHYQVLSHLVRSYRMYQLFKHPFSGEISSIRDLEKDCSIPIDEANTDYRTYLEWLAEGNTPLPADE
jgi:hypothetical protein